MDLNFRNLSAHPAVYPIATAIFFAFCGAIFTVDEYGRVLETHRSAYLVLKCFFSLAGLSFAAWFYLRKANDLSLGLFASILNLYVLTFMWYAPLYEMAYLQGSIAASFFRFQRNWIFPLVFGLGLVGILLTYHAQDEMHWQLPAETRSDWILISLIMFLVSSLVQRFASGQTAGERERIERLSALGHDAVRILHDVKGLSSTPLLLSQRVVNAGDLQELAVSLEKVQKFLRTTQRLVNVRETIRKIQLVTLLAMVQDILAARLKGIEIDLPKESFEVECNPNRMFSVLYNVLLILGESFDEIQTTEAKIWVELGDGMIRIFDNNLVHACNVRSGAQELRERVIASDLRRMNWRGRFSHGPAGNCFAMQIN